MDFSLINLHEISVVFFFKKKRCKSKTKIRGGGIVQSWLLQDSMKHRPLLMEPPEHFSEV